MLYTIYTTLREHFGNLHGPQAGRAWWPIFGTDPPLEMLLGAVLVQQTRWETVEAAILRLQAAGLLDTAALAAADPAELAALLRPAAFYTQKAPALITIGAYIRDHYAGSTAALLARPTAELRSELLALPRIGPETADVVLLYAGQHPVFVVDDYTRRLFERIDPALATVSAANGQPAFAWRRARYAAVQALIEQELDDGPGNATASAETQHAAVPQLYADFHALINEQCVRYCLSRPRCDGPPARRVYSRQDGRESYIDRHDGCPLRAVCAFYRATRNGA